MPGPARAQRACAFIEAPCPTPARPLTPSRPPNAELRRCLCALFGQFGRVVDVVAMKTERLRGQAWVVFADVTAATNALRAMQEFPFFGKAMVSDGGSRSQPGSQAPLPAAFTRPSSSQRVQYARTKSDAAAKLDGTWHMDKRTRKETAAVPAHDVGEPPAGAAAKQEAAAPADGGGDPNNILFLENLPEATNEAMLGVLFQQFPGEWRNQRRPASELTGLTPGVVQCRVQGGQAGAGQAWDCLHRV